MYNRRNFIKATTLATLSAVLASNSFASVIKSGENICLLVLPDDVIVNNESSKWAINELKVALKANKVNIRTINKIEDADGFCIIVSGLNTKLAQNILKQENIAAPTEPESLCLAQTRINNRNILLAAGTDISGLVYALTELADRVNCIKTNREALEFSVPLLEKPASKIRSVLRNFSSEVEDKAWFYDKSYWRNYLDLLVYSRLNRFNFSTGMGYNSVRDVTDGYMVFPYPFFVKVPGYQVTARGLPDEERQHNLEMLKFIGKETSKRCIEFQFGVWTLAYKWEDSPNATYKIDGLTDSTHADYCRKALAIMLEEIPEINGITFRVHSESGIPKGDKTFWEIQFSAISECGRKVELDMHGKNLEPNTLQAALYTKQPVVVSPKFCGEHLGLPYPEASIRNFEMKGTDTLVDTGEGLLKGNRGFTRYGYADYLSENRTWDVLYRIWPGTQRFLLSGDPALFAGYGRTASFCGALGYELCEPLDFKGRLGTGVPGGRCGYSDISLKPRYDFEKYDYFYRTWGRLAYNPDTSPEVWRRSLTNNFGTAGRPVENALAQVTRILPLFYMAHAVSADCMVYWPEIYENSYVGKDTHWPNDAPTPKTFGNTSAIDPQLFQSPDECGESLIKGENTGKYTPLEVAQWMEEMSESASRNIKEARNILGAKASQPNFRRIEEDVLILVGMARFFAAKFRCGVLWKIYILSGDRRAGEKAIELYANGRNIWFKMAKRALTVYKTNISYGPRGHWIDRIPSFDEDIADLKKRIENPRIYHVEGIPGFKVETTVVEQAIKQAVSKPIRPIVQVEHTPKETFQRGKALPISLKIEGKPHGVVLYYRHVDQSERWKTVELTENKSTYHGEIPSEFTNNRFPLQYYFEIETSPSRATLYPALDDKLANVPYYVIHGKL